MSDILVVCPNCKSSHVTNLEDIFGVYMSKCIDCGLLFIVSYEDEECDDNE